VNFTIDKERSIFFPYIKSLTLNQHISQIALEIDIFWSDRI